MTDLQRILSIARRAPWPEGLEARMTAMLKTPQGAQSLRTVQAQALFELVRQRQVAPERVVACLIGVGGGKSLTCYLAPSVIPCRNPILLCEAGLRDKALWEIPALRTHWKIRADLSVRSYDELSRNPDLLRQQRTDLVICDEAQALARLGSGRTRRVVRAARTDPNIRWMMLSGTLTKRSLLDFAHLFELSLRAGAPLPFERSELEAWARCMDPDAEAETSDWGMVKDFWDAMSAQGIVPQANAHAWHTGYAERQAALRSAWRAWLDTSPGVIVGEIVDVEVGLRFHVEEPVVSDLLKEAVKCASAGLPIPGTDEESGLDVLSSEEDSDSEEDRATNVEHLGMGFYYRPDWSRGPLGRVDKDYCTARAIWSSQLTEYLVPGGQGEREGIDTPGQVIERILQTPEKCPVMLVRAWQRWALLRDRYVFLYPEERKPALRQGQSIIPVHAIWLDDGPVKQIKEWLKDGGIAWYRHRAVAQRLRDLGVRVCWPGQTPPDDGRPVALSEKAHGRGFNLTSHTRMLIPVPDGRADHLEQLVGRCHRPDPANKRPRDCDEVSVTFWAQWPHLQRALALYRRRAQYLQVVQGPQKVFLGTWQEPEKLAGGI